LSILRKNPGSVLIKRASFDLYAPGTTITIFNNKRYERFYRHVLALAGCLP
jgi:hypothetical protein